MTTYTTASLARDLLEAGFWLGLCAAALVLGVLLVSAFLRGSHGR